MNDGARNITDNTIIVLLSFCAATAAYFDRSVEVACFEDFLDAQKTCMGVGPAVVLACIIALALKWRDRLRVKGRVAYIAAAVILSQCWWIGSRLDNDIEIIKLSFWGLFQWFIVSLGTGFFVYGFITLLFERLEVLKLLDASFQGEKGSAKWFRTSFVSCVIVWFVYYIIYYPGVVTNDSYWQINQALGFEPLSNHHPFMHTLLESLFLKPAYYMMHNTELGIGVFILFQLVIMALFVAYSQKVLYEMEVDKRLLIGIQLFYAANPLFGMYSVTMWKDVWMGMFLLLFLILLVKRLFLDDSSARMSILICLSALGVLFSKATGIAMVLFSLLAIIILGMRKEKSYLRTAIPIIASMVLFFAIQSFAINVAGIVPSESRESKSVPLQQIARTVKINNDSLTEDEKTAIAEILPYDDLAENYNPRLSDPVKNFFNENNYEKDHSKYIRLWISLGMKYPATYIKAFMYNTYGYWYPDTDYWVATSQSYGEFLTNGQNETYDQYLYKYHMSDDYRERRSIFLRAVFSVRRIPGVSLLFSVGAYFWAYFVIMIWSLRKRRAKMILPLMIVLAVFISCLISPLYCEMRYAYPAVIIMPVVIALCMKGDKKEEVEIKTGEGQLNG